MEILDPMICDDFTLGQMDQLNWISKVSKEFIDSGLFEKNYTEFTKHIDEFNFVLYKPDKSNNRKERQSGLFMICRNSESKHDLSRVECVKIDLKLSEKKKLKAHLNQIGVDNNFLFPEDCIDKNLESICTSITTHYSIK